MASAASSAAAAAARDVVFGLFGGSSEAAGHGAWLGGSTQEEEAEDGLLSSFSDRLATPAESVLLASLQRELQEDLAAAPKFPELVGEFRLLRTLRSLRHRIPEAAEAFRAHLAKRREVGLDTVREHVLQTWGDRLWELPLEDLPHGECVCNYLPQVVPFAHTPKGDPIALYRWGMWRMVEFVNEVDDWREKFKQHSYYQLEARALLLDRTSREQGRLTHLVNVHDLKNWSLMSQFETSCATFQKDEMLPLAGTYHDFSSYAFFINTSRWFHVPFNMFYPLLPKNTQDKIFLFGEDFHASPELHKELGETAVTSLSVLPSCRVRASTSKPCRDGGHAVAAPMRGQNSGLGRLPTQHSSLCGLAPAKAISAETVEVCAARVFFALASSRVCADVELQSKLHSAILEPLAGQKALCEFRVHWAASLPSSNGTCTLLVFELLVPKTWLGRGDWDVRQWRQRLVPQGIHLAGPESGGAEAARQALEACGAVGAAVGTGISNKEGLKGVVWLQAFEQMGAVAIVELVMLLLCMWLSL